MHEFADDPFAEIASAGCPPSLYPLPMECSHGQPEGLLSWIAGLANAHCVGPRLLLRHLMSRSDAYRDVWHGSTFFERDSGTVNGLGIYAQMMLDIFRPALPSDFGQMTLLPLTHLLPRNGEGLLAKHPRWCHACLCDQARSGVRPHFPLVWSFEYYRVCHVHRVAMCEHCPACGSTQAYLPSYPSLLHCDACGGPLIGSLPADFSMVDPEASEFDLWCSAALVDLVEKLPALHGSGSVGNFCANLGAIVDRFAQGNRKRLCESIGLQIYALNGWVNKGERPSLAVLLRLCCGVGLMPARMFLPDAVMHASRSTLADPPIGSRELRPLLGYRQRERIQKQLDVILADPNDHRGLAAVAEQVGLSRHALKYWFRSQSWEIVRKSRMCESRRLEARYREDHAFLKATVQNFCAAGVYPSRRRVNAELASRQVSLMRPDLLLLYERLRISCYA